MSSKVEGTRQGPLVELSGLTKRYGGVLAVDALDLEVYAGEVTAIVGENGAGKSTLMKILAGAVQPDAGVFVVNGHEVTFPTVRDANRAGIAIVFQELSLFPELDVLANLFMPDLPTTRSGLFDRRAAEKKARPVLEAIGLDVDLSAEVSTLRLGDQQLLEIARGLLADASLLILDEPNSALNSTETERLLKIVRQLRDEGRAILYISHRLAEVMSIADRVVVMRDGRIVRDAESQEVTIGDLVTDMLGKQLAEAIERPHRPLGDQPIAIEFTDVSCGEQLDAVSFQARRGEVLGVAGLSGAGHGTIFDILFGRARATSGEVWLSDERGAPNTIVEAVERGIAFVPSDRRGQGLSLGQSISENITTVRALSQRRMGYFLRRSSLTSRSTARADELRVKRDHVDDPVHSLSGGNQQKVVLGKWLEAEPTIILLEDPTRGVDVGSKTEIYALVTSLADQGITVLFQSSELQEYAALCDRVLVFHDQQLSLVLEGQQISEQNLLESTNTGRLAA